jgi:hypothetical protein
MQQAKVACLASGVLYKCDPHLFTKMRVFCRFVIWWNLQYKGRGCHPISTGTLALGYNMTWEHRETKF